MKFERTLLRPGVALNYAGTDKFKKNNLSIHFVLPHERETAALSSLVGDVMTRGTVSFPDLLSLEKELDNCYGAAISSDSFLKGEAKIVSISLEVIGNEYAFDGEDIFARAFRVLREILFCPVTQDGAFLREYVESEKEKLICAIGRRKNNKRVYASDRCRALMCADEPYGIPSYGSEEAVAAVDAASLYAFYQKMLREAPVEIFFVGTAKKEEVVSALAELFDGGERKDCLPLPLPVRVTPSATRYECEETDYKQSVLVMGMRLSTDPHRREDACAFTMFNALFGSGVNSRLFKVVREKLHLCYYASCAPDMIKGTAMIYTGIDQKNETVAREEIMRQLEAIQAGEFTEQDMEDCKATLANAYEEINDSADALCSWYLGRVIYGITESNEEVIGRILRVGREDVLRAARMMMPDTVFMLRGMAKHDTDAEGEEEAEG